MKLGSIRELEGNRPVLRDPKAEGPDPVYWVFPEISDKKWANMTVIVPGLYSGEFPKTFGHYHGVDSKDTPPDETYHLIEGEGILQMQKKLIDEKGEWQIDKVVEVYLIKAKPGDEIVIKPEWGHSWSNVGKGPLISFDNWRSGHTPADYEGIKSLQGLAYYLVEDPSTSHSTLRDEPSGSDSKSSGQGMGVKAVPNPNYQDPPEPMWVTAEEFKELNSRS